MTYTTAEASKTITLNYIKSTLTVNVKSNQSGETILDEVTVSYGSTTKKVTPGETIDIPINTSITVTYPEKIGYTTPSAVTFTNTGGDVVKEGTYNTTIVTVTMITNQSSHTDISNAKVTIVGGNVNTSVASGTAVKVPTGVSTKLTFSAVTDYKTPSSQTFTTSGTSVSKSATYNTEVLTITVKDDSGTNISAPININGTSYTINGSMTKKFAYGTSITITPSDLEGYTTPASQSRTAASQSATIAIVYPIKSVEVYIINTNHKCYTATQWSQSSNHGTAMGVAVIADETSFVIAPTFQRHWIFSYDWSTYNGGPVTEDSTFIEPTEEDAIINFDGKLLTSQIYNVVKNLTATFTTSALNNYYWPDTPPNTATGQVTGSPAINYVYSYEFPDGTAGSQNNYIGSLGQWTILNDNKEKVNECLDLIADYNLDTMTYTNDFIGAVGNVYWASSSAYIAWTTQWILSRIYYNYDSNINNGEPHYTMHLTCQNLSDNIANWTENDNWSIEAPAHIVPFCDLPSNVTFM